MKKIILIFIAFLLTFAVAFFQKSNASENISIGDVKSPGILPDSPFYFLKEFVRSARLLFAFNPAKKSELELKFANEDVLAIQKLIEKGRYDLAQKLSLKYQERFQKAISNLEQAKEKGKNVDYLIDRLKENQLKHQEVLAKVLEKMPPQGQEGILNAIEKSNFGLENAIEKIQGENQKKEFQERVRKEIQNYNEDIRLKIKERLKLLETPIVEKENATATTTTTTIATSAAATTTATASSATSSTTKNESSKNIGNTNAKNDEKCEKYSRGFSRDQCYLDLAKDKKDISYCNNIDNQNSKGICYSNIAVSKNNLDICNSLTTDKAKYTCYKEYAQSKKDISICDKIQENSIKEDCYLEVASEGEYISLCDKLSDDFSKVMCQMEVVENIAKKEKDIYLSLCQRIDLEASRANCYRVAAILKKDPSICDNITGEAEKENKAWCYSDSISTREHLPYCEKMPNDFYRYTCYAKVAVNSKDVTLCEKISDLKYSGVKDNCYLKIAQETKNSSLCQKITDPETKDECLQTIH